MKGDGFYDQNSAPQMASVAAVLPWLEDAVVQMDLSDSMYPVVVVDYGCSEGRNSIAAMQPIIAAIRARTSRPIQTIHGDLPTNNFNQLFVNLAAADLSSASRSQVYSMAVGGSMFEQLLPPGTVNIAMTFNAVGWLDRLPQAEIADYIMPMGPSRQRPGVAVTEEARRLFANQAADDLVRFYRARAEETVSGGKLLNASFGADEHHRACDGIYDVLNDALLDVRESGRLDPDAYRRLIFPLYFRTPEELIAPVVGDNSPVAGCFRVDRVESLDVGVPFNLRPEQSGDNSADASKFTGFLRAFSEPILRMSFANHDNLDALIEETYQRVQARLIANPADYEFHYIEVAALLTRERNGDADSC
jgi:gibberellin A4 carboxyl methyltransferase